MKWSDFVSPIVKFARTSPLHSQAYRYVVFVRPILEKTDPLNGDGDNGHVICEKGLPCTSGTSSNSTRF